jgi:predicted phosphodiesterase
MKIAVISDAHLGNPDSKFIENGALTNTYESFRLTIRKFNNNKPLDYLVLNGDTLDFTSDSIEKIIAAARPFFQGIHTDKLAKNLIYIPGNHDKQIWDMVECESNVIGRLRQHESPRKFRRTMAGVLDATSGRLELLDPNPEEETTTDGTSFLKGFFDKRLTLPITVTYPNLYIKTKADLILVTHGHIVGLVWVLLSELLGSFVKEGKLSLAEIEEYNAPLTSLICNGVGRGNEMSELFYRIQKEARQGKSRELKKALNSIIPIMDSMIPLGLFEFFDNALLQGLKMLAIFVARNRVSDPRYNRDYLKDPVIKERFQKFYSAACEEAALLNLGPPNKLIYGHTHEVIAASEPVPIKNLEELYGEDLLTYNTGGWLESKGKSAEVFFIDEEGEISSETIGGQL